MIKFKEMKYVLVAIMSLFFIVSCAKNKKEDTPQKTETKAIKTIKKVEVPKKEKFITVDADGVVNVSMITNDRMKFNLREIKVKAGQKVKLTLTHTGKLNKNIMGHNVVFLNKGVKRSTFASKAAASRENDYIPEGTTDVLAYTIMLGGGEKTTIEFTAPEAGVYDYICSFPGHYAMMKGELIVQ
jgi:azurin